MQQILRGRYGQLSLAAFVVGVVLILLSELAGLDYLRAAGAALISVGGIGLGVLAGLDEPRRTRWLGTVRGQRVTLGVIAAVLLVLPVIAALVAGLVGLVAAFDLGLNTAVVGSGGAITALMLAMTLAGTGIAIQAIRRAGRTSAPSNGARAPEEEAP